jgi:hypothetical protein
MRMQIKMPDECYRIRQTNKISFLISCNFLKIWKYLPIITFSKAVERW